MNDEKKLEEEPDHLESGDNPFEREKEASGKEPADMHENENDHLESGDNPAEREHKAGK